ncbi:TonB-dependent receptor [Chitinophaga horti]|uniref:TonB-dependent receptor n=1 Tax=Chitinophaga horti TaxID=2920382 RepID=A0ABY6J152_9BACT|nr:TonB-dependent receptor [Chitinophaga horti]UYQ93250.1 TonB-dependent receptor [Chitinophaga horti]
MNLNLQATGGFVAKKDASKGWAGVFSFTYNKQNRAGSIIRNNYLPSDLTPTFNYRDQFYRQNVLIGGLANFTYRNRDTKISLKNSYTINSNDQTTLREGTDIEGTAVYGIRSQELAFTSNRLLNSQLLGEHFLKGSNIKVKWNGSIGWMSQDIPDMRRLKYTSLNNDGNYYVNVPKFTGNPRNAGRFFSDLNEVVLGANADATKTFKIWGNQQQVKVGGLFQRKDRTFNARALAIIGGENSDPLLTLPASEIFNKENFASDKFYLDDLTEPSDAYKAYANLAAGFVQFDNQFGEKLRVVWGARVEYFLQSLRSENGNPSENSATDILPSANFTYMLNARTNLRLTGSQTVARPEFREIAPFAFYDFERNGTVFGNTSLERTKITNLDLRYELYPAAGELLTFGVFYKHFKSPIEMMFENAQGSPNFTYANAESATNFGAEIEFRKKLDFFGPEFLKNFALFGNAAWVNSEVKFRKGYIGVTDRPMYGQSPYLVNAGLQFDNETSGTNASVLFNLIGQRIAQVGNATTPNIWENPRPLLDFQITQKVFKNADIKFSAADILNQKATFYWGQDKKKYNEGKDLVLSQFTYGTNISVTFNYKF